MGKCGSTLRSLSGRSRSSGSARWRSLGALTQGESAFDVTVGLAFGLALLAGLYAFAEVSGGHFNPAVSIAMFLDRRLALTT